ncbi:unnamed protein product [Euphydryas editha]|uniref:Reverse transcriptase RNase H-like domain-containing protein n=1 Tax=Euphydryas editha TaxID=104508 RepID=A0AAU9TSI6_EUPED|nr:unnamed protein product [Euphydryas editha]
MPFGLRNAISVFQRAIVNALHNLVNTHVINVIVYVDDILIISETIEEGIERLVELHTDASSEGYGAILFQIVQGKRRIVAYFSKRTTPAESRYHSYELETLAVVNAIKQFRQYLHGRKFTVLTDCNSLKSSSKKIDLTPRVHRWWAYLQCFDFDVVYNKGKDMAHADFLSRNHPPTLDRKVNVESKPKVELNKIINLTELSGNWLLAEQKRDSEISKLISDLNNGQLNDDVAKTYEIRKGVLNRKIQRNGRTKYLPILPRTIRWSVVSNVHESLIHLGYDKT